MKKTVLMGLVSASLAYGGCKDYVTYQIATGSTTGTYYQIGKNLAKYVAPSACIKLEVLTTKGSMDNVYKLRSAKYPKLKFAIVQNDVLQELKNYANKGNKKAADLVKNIRVLLPLYNEEIHILSRASSNINTFGDLKDKTISIGPQKSGTAMTSFLLYKELFGTDLKKFKNEDFKSALRSLSPKNKSVDAIVVVAGQPVSKLKKFSQKAKNFIKLLTYDEKNMAHKPITSYYTTEIKKSSYDFIDTNIPTLSTKSYLITFNYKNPIERAHLTDFLNSLKSNLPKMKESASNDKNTPHPKWKQVSNVCDLEKLPGGWKYYDIINSVCNVNISNSTMKNSNTTNQQCSDYEKSVGLCE